MKKITNLRGLKERIKNKIITNKKKVETFLLAFFLVNIPTISAYATIDGKDIQNKVLNNYIGPMLFIVVGIGLLREIVKKNTAGIIISVCVAGLVWIFVYQPNALTVVGNTIKSILGL